MTDYQPSPTWVPIDKILPAYYHGLNEYNRSGKAGSHLVELAESIKRHGIVDPLITTSALELVSGTRRLAAAKLLGMTEVPVIARDNEALFHALVYDAKHPSQPNLVVEGNYEDKLKHGLLIFRVLYDFLNELKGRRIAKNQAERHKRAYKGPEIPEITGEDIPAILGLGVSQWTKLRFLAPAVGAPPPLNPRVEFTHNAERARHWLDFGIRTHMIDKAQGEYAKECRPPDWEETPHNRTHPTDAAVTVSPERFTRTFERSLAVVNTTLATLEQLGGVPDKLTFDQLNALAKELSETVRESTKIRLRLNAALKDRQHSKTSGSSKS